MESTAIVLSLKAASEEYKLPEYTVRRLFLEKRLKGFRIGKKIYINVESLKSIINGEDN